MRDKQRTNKERLRMIKQQNMQNKKKNERN